MTTSTPALDGERSAAGRVVHKHLSFGQ